MEESVWWINFTVCTEFSSLIKQKGFFFFENVAPQAVSDSKTPSADRMELTGMAFCASCTILFCLRRIVDIRDALFKNVSEGGRKLPAGMHLTVRKHCEKIEGSSAAECRTAPKWLEPFFI